MSFLDDHMAPPPLSLTSCVPQHKDAYQVILDGVKGGPKEKRLAAQFIPKFFCSFPEMADAAINAQLDLCEDEDVSVSRSAFCAGRVDSQKKPHRPYHGQY